MGTVTKPRTGNNRLEAECVPFGRLYPSAALVYPKATLCIRSLLVASRYSCCLCAWPGRADAESVTVT